MSFFFLQKKKKLFMKYILFHDKIYCLYKIKFDKTTQDSILQVAY